MIGNLWNCPKGPLYDKFGCFAGAGTVGSTEACLLGGLALKFRWRQWYGKRHNLTKDQVLGVRPNLLISTCFQAAWEKFFKYMDVEAKLLPTHSNTFSFDPKDLEGLIDDKTIGVVCIMGNHYGGQYDPVMETDAEITRINKKNGFIVGIHIDGASGGFIAPFQDQKRLNPWDFRLPNVMSISASGHKFGGSVCGTGWIVWRHRKNLSEHVAISVSYLGGTAESYTLNFSRPASGVYVQLFKFLRLGKAGYKRLVSGQLAVADELRSYLRNCTLKSGSKRFEMLDGDANTPSLPVTAACLNDDNEVENYNCIDLQHTLAEDHWYVGGYRMSYKNPNTHKEEALFVDRSKDKTMFRIVVKSNLTSSLARGLMMDFDKALSTLDAEKGFIKKDPRRKRRQQDDYSTSHVC